MIFAFVLYMQSSIITKYPEILHFVVKKNGNFPGNKLPVLIYKNVLNLSGSSDASSRQCEQIISNNDWRNNWTDSIFDFNHYHSNTHEVLCVNCGDVRILLGGPNGREEHLIAGDVVILPAGVSHKRIEASGDFSCVGGYPGGKEYDMNYGENVEVVKVNSISKVSVPSQDPIFGENGPLFDLWK